MVSRMNRRARMALLAGLGLAGLAATGLITQRRAPDIVGPAQVIDGDSIRVAGIDPGNAGWQRDLSVPYNKVGDVLVAQGNLPEALKSFRDSLAIAERLAKADPGNAGWQRDLAISYGRVATTEAQTGARDRALSAFRRGRDIIVMLK